MKKSSPPSMQTPATATPINFGDSVDFDRAATPDRQGIGGPKASARLEQERLLPASRSSQA